MTPAAQYKQAFETYIRTGESAGLRALEIKALPATLGSAGGYSVPPEIEAKINERLAAISPIRSIAGRPKTTTELATSWFPTMELYAMPAATAALLGDPAVNIDEWLAQEVEQVFAAQEDTAFVTGNGADKPKGFLAYETVANHSWEWGKLGYTVSGISAAFPAANPSDVLVDLIYSVKASYRQNATFVMNRKTQSSVRKLKDADGNYLWQPPMVAGGKPSLLTFPVVESEDMPDISEGSLSIAFGDFNRGYLIVDRPGMTVLRDPYTAKPYVLFYTTKRVGGGVQDFDAIKLLKMSVR